MDAAFTHRIAPRADLLFPGDTTNGGQNRTDGKLTAAAAPASCCMPQPNRRVIAPLASPRPSGWLSPLSSPFSAFAGYPRQWLTRLYYMAHTPFKITWAHGSNVVQP